MSLANFILLKSIIIGNCGVGKTSMLERYHRNYFNEKVHTTIGIDFAIHHIKIDNYSVKLQIWDTSGQEKFHSITRSYYRTGDICLLVYDVTDPDSFQDLARWYREYRESNHDGIVAIVGNKIDCPRQISHDQLQNFADQIGCIYTEVSNKTGEGVASLFDRVVRAAIRKKIPENFQKPTAEQLVYLSDAPSTRSYCVNCSGSTKKI